jgi:hypothetical protein
MPETAATNTLLLEDSTEITEQGGSTGSICKGLAQAGDGFPMLYPVICKLRLLKIIQVFTIAVAI